MCVYSEKNLNQVSRKPIAAGEKFASNRACLAMASESGQRGRIELFLWRAELCFSSFQRAKVKKSSARAKISVYA